MLKDHFFFKPLVKKLFTRNNCEISMGGGATKHFTVKMNNQKQANFQMF